MKKVAISYGVAEGRISGRRLRKELRDEGYSITSKLKDADIIIAHSGGAFKIPFNHNAEVVILVGLPTLVSHYLLIGIYNKFTSDLRIAYRSLFILEKSLINIIYSIIRPLHHLKIWKGYKSGIHKSMSATRLVVVRNKSDIFSDFREIKSYNDNYGWIVVSMDGDHDDIWTNPKKYVELISKINELN